MVEAAFADTQMLSHEDLPMAALAVLLADISQYDGPAELARRQGAKNRALAVADERSKENAELRAEICGYGATRRST